MVRSLRPSRTAAASRPSRATRSCRRAQSCPSPVTAGTVAGPLTGPVPASRSVDASPFIQASNPVRQSPPLSCRRPNPVQPARAETSWPIAGQEPRPPGKTLGASACRTLSNSSFSLYTTPFSKPGHLVSGSGQCYL